MTLPGLDDRGLLPPGEHVCSIEQLEASFARSTQRRAQLWNSFKTFIATELMPWADGMDLVIGGSFLSDKAQPDDIDATLRVPLSAPHGVLSRAVTTFGGLAAHARIYGQYRVDFYVTIVGLGNDFGVFFQYVGEKTAAQMNLYKSDLRGVAIVRLQST